MKTAILTLTCGRLEMTVETWRHNFANHGAGDVRVFWFDNGSTPDELAVMMEEAAKWRFAFTQFETQNKGIAYALNWMMKAAFATGAHAVATMANDIKEPNGWLDFRIRAAKDIYHTGVVAVAVDQSTRYPPKHVNGWMIEEGTKLFDELVVAIGVNPDKSYTFTLEERLDMLRESIGDESAVSVGVFENQFLVNYASSVKAQYVLRGIRTPADYEYERGMRQINSDLNDKVTTVFLMPPREIAEVSSSLVKGLVGPDCWQDVIQRYVPEPVYRGILNKYGSGQP